MYKLDKGAEAHDVCHCPLISLFPSLISFFNSYPLTLTPQVFRVDDCTVLNRSTPTQALLDVALIHPEPQNLVLEFADATHLDAWQCALQVASEWWTDNKPKREKLQSLSVRLGSPGQKE